MKRSRLILTVVLLLGLAAPLCRGQERVFTDVIDVRVVNLDVVVTDRQGRRVAGLGPKDFRLLVDGREVPIEYFTEIQEGRAVAPAAGSTTAGVPDVAGGQPVRTNYLIFVDRYFPMATDQREVLGSMLEQLPVLSAEDRVAVVSFDGRRLEMLASWTGSREEIEGALKAAAGLPTGGMERYAESEAYERGELTRTQYEQEGADPESGEPIAPFAESPDLTLRFDQLERQIDRISRAAAASLRSFAAPPGRKVMVLLSGGWPWDTAAYLTGESDTGFDLPRSEAPEMLRRISNTANLLGYTLYMVDMPTTRDQGRRESEIHAGLDVLAQETGGRALHNAAGLDALATVAEDVRSYYWLGFTADWKGDRKEHDIEVRVAGEGLEVRSREGFVDLAREEEVTMMTESALMFGGLPGARPLGVELGAPQGGRKSVEVPVTVLIPMDLIQMLPTADGYAARLELRIAVLDEEGTQNEIPVIPVVLSGETLPAPGQYARYETAIKMRRQVHNVVVSLYDVATGVILSETIQGYDPDRR